MAPPSGGPEDKTPPALLSVDPPSGSTEIPQGFSVTFTFSERIDESTIPKGIRVSPALRAPLGMSLKKDELIVTFPQEMQENQTYLISVTRDIFDEHRNRLDRTYQVAFSTGEEISQGNISGAVYSREGVSSFVYLYRADGMDLDSLFLGPPDYFGETDDSGRYSFSFLEPGSYQVLALQGGIPPAILVPDRMPYGVHWQAPIRIRHVQDTVNSVNIKTSREPPPIRVVSAKMETPQRGVIQFTNPVHLSAQEKMKLELLPDMGGETLIPGYLFQYRDGENRIHFRSEEIVAGNIYALTLSGIQDSLGQILSEFTRSLVVPERDTLGPAVVAPEPGETVTLDPGEIPLGIQFSDVVVIDSMQKALAIRDTSQSVLTISRWKNATNVQVMPSGGWLPKMEYQVSLFGNWIASPEGLTLKDSSLVFTVGVNQERGFGGLFGSVDGQYRLNSRVTARTVEKPSISYSTNVNLEGRFAFTKLPAGFWLLRGYQDRDGNSRYTYGRAIPFQPAEPFLVSPDTLEIRANWDLEDVLLEYPGRD